MKSLNRAINKRLVEARGRTIAMLTIAIMIVLTFGILYMVASKGLSTFVINKASIFEFFTGKSWNPAKVDGSGKAMIGALPMIFGSFAVTLLATIISAPFAIGAAVFSTKISPKMGKRFLQPMIELLTGIPSVVYGFVGLSIIVPFMRTLFSGSGFGVASGALVLSIMILPTITSLTIDALRAVPQSLRDASLALGATRFQTIYRVILRSATPGMMTAIIFGMARAFGEALAVQMVIGNSAVIPHSLVQPASTLTSILTMGMGNTVMGQIENNALWTLALMLLIMSLIFILIVRFLSRRRMF